MKTTVWILAAVLTILLSAVFIFLFFNNPNSHAEKIDDNEQIRLNKFKDDSLKKALELKFNNKFPKITYTVDSIKNAKQLYKILWKYRKNDSSNFANRVFTLLNRRELRFIRVGSTIVIPDTVFNDLKAYSVFPQYYHEARNIPKIIMVSNRLMSYGCYENGHLVRFAACNPGKEKTPSYPGRYALNWKEKNHKSSLDSSWIMPFTWNFHSEAGSAFHQFDMPGYPASHSCIRQFAQDAEWLYYWGRGTQKDSNKKFIPMSGTPVIIIDHYDFHSGKGRLWTKLSSNKDSLLKLPDNPLGIEEALIPISQIPEAARGRLRNRSRYIHAEDTLRARGVIRENVQLIVSVDFNKKKREKAAKEFKAEQKRLLQKQ